MDPLSLEQREAAYAAALDCAPVRTLRTIVYELDWDAWRTRFPFRRFLALDLDGRLLNDVRCGWREGLYSAIWTGDSRDLVADVYGSPTNAIGDPSQHPEATLESLFWIFNHQPTHLHQQDCAPACPARGHRSLSIGDLITFEIPSITDQGVAYVDYQVWLVRSAGWTQIELPALAPVNR